MMEYLDSRPDPYDHVRLLNSRPTSTS